MAKRRSKRKSVRSGSDLQRSRSQAPKPEAAVQRPAPLLTAATALAGLGALLTAYLTLVRWLGDSPAYCAAGSGCDLVQESRWSVLLGLPLSLWGFLTYVVLVSLLWQMRKQPRAWTRAITVAAFGTGFSIYLTAISVFVIQATCPYCLASFVIVSAIFVFLLFLRPPHLPKFDWGVWGIGTGAGTAIVIVAIHLHFSGMFDPSAGPEKPYLQALAEHLADEKAVFYGASWCPNCQTQKDLFEASAHRLPYVECSPAGRGGPVAVACVTNGIERYPTWVIEGRKHTGVQTPKTLARLSAFKAPASTEP